MIGAVFTDVYAGMFPGSLRAAHTFSLYFAVLRLALTVPALSVLKCSRKYKFCSTANLKTGKKPLKVADWRKTESFQLRFLVQAPLKNLSDSSWIWNRLLGRMNL